MGDLFESRRSVRRFTEAEVSQQAVDQLLAAAIAAPSGGNCQPWHIYVVRAAALKTQLGLDAFGQTFIAQAPVVFVICAEPERSAARYGERGATLYCLQDTAAVVENLLLKAAELGLGGCWCGAFSEEAVTATLNLPNGRRPVAVVPVGEPKVAGAKTPRRALGEVVTYL